MSTNNEDHMDNANEQFIVTDRYLATGTPYPDPETVCKGQCEGMGCYPIPVDDATMSAEERSRVDAYIVEHGAPDDGWVFITCPDCEGTRLRPR